MPQAKTWTIRDVLSWTSGYLEHKGDERPRLSAEWLISATLGLSRVEIYLNFDRPLTSEELALLHRAIEQRAAGKPLQYITGEMPFRHIVLRCEKGVLIPRPETEILVECVLEALDEKSGQLEKHADGHDPGDSVAGGGGTQESNADDSNLRVLEIGCGTGCICASIASERPGTCVVATDIAPAAVALARRNCDVLGLGDAVHIYECNLADAVPSELMGSFDVLVSNPPYLPTEILDSQVPDEVVLFEPREALDGGADGLVVFRRLLEIAPYALTPNGVLAVELYEKSLDVARELLSVQGFWRDIRIVEDLTHRPRVLMATRAVSCEPTVLSELSAPCETTVPCEPLAPCKETLHG